MVTYICHRCGKFFQHKGGFKKHLLKPEICPALVSNKSRLEILKYYHINTMEYSIEESSSVEEENKGFVNETALKKNMQKNDFTEKSIIKVEDCIMKVKDDEGKTKFKCPYCHGYYSRKNNLVSHIKNFCKMVKNESIQVEKDELQKIKEEIEKLSGQTQIVNNYNNTTNNLQQINQNILLQAFGKETPPKITDEFMSKVLKNPMKGIPDLISLHHFNPKKPENNNVRYNGKRAPFIDVFNGNFWEAKDKGEVIYDMIVSKKDMADDYFDEAVEKNRIKENIKDNYNSFSEKIDRYVNAIINELNYGQELIEQDKELYKQLYKQVELMMINAQRILTLKSKKAPSPFQTIE